MKKAIKALAGLAAIASVSACIDISDLDLDGGGGGGTSSADSQYNQVFSFQRGIGGTGTMTQTVLSGAGSAGNSRVCFVNNGPVEAMLVHGTPGTNPLRATPGGQSCANFPSSSRISFTMTESNGFLQLPATPDRGFVYSLSPFDGDILQLVWQAR